MKANTESAAVPRLTEARRQDRKAMFLGAARDVFGAQGFENSSIATIARAAGVSDGLLYRYFVDKRQLLSAVLEEFLDEIIVQAERAVASADGFEPQLCALMTANLTVYVREPEMCRLFIREQRDASDYRGSPLQARMRQYTDLLRGVVHNAIDRGDARPGLDERLVRDFIFGGMEHLAWRSLSAKRPEDIATRAAELARMLVRGMGQ